MPKFYRIDSFAGIVEPITPIDRFTLVVAPEQEEVLWVLDLVRHEQADGRNTVVASVDVVSQEEVVGTRREATTVEVVQQILELPVDVTQDVDGRHQLKEDGLRFQHFLGR